MSAGHDASRRRFLLSLLLGLVAGRTLVACDSSTESRHVPGQAPEWLLKITGERDAVVRIGKDYLEAFPAERNVEALMSAIESSFEAVNAAAADAGEIVTALQQAVRGDYQRGDVAQVNGWILSRTEARLYAAVALLSA
ncbi:MAG: hypothetical protein J5I92_05165 [Thiogranum sp.]|nr:hypothetical protein [Thiogranum sp.]